MRKVMILVNAADDAVGWTAALRLDGLRGRRVVLSEDPAAIPVAAVSLWLDTVDDDAIIDAVAGLDGLDGLDGHAYEVDEHLRFHDATPTLVRAVFVRRLPALDGTAFVRAWEHHATLARIHHPAICRYIQDIVVRTITPGAPWYDGVSELGFWDREAMENRMYDSPEGQTLMEADFTSFLDVAAGTRVLGPEPLHDVVVA